MESAVDILAEITLFPGSISGKTSGYFSGVRPNHFFSGQPSSIVGVIWFENQFNAELGSTTTAKVRLMYPETYPPLVAGTTWRIQEGSRHVGNAKVVQLLPTNQ